jgi:hypothetical protein
VRASQCSTSVHTNPGSRPQLGHRRDRAADRRCRRGDAGVELPRPCGPAVFGSNWRSRASFAPMPGFAFS